MSSIAHISYLAIIELAKVPFGIIRGPAWILSTQSPASSAWLGRAFTTASAAHGILLKVDDDGQRRINGVTEILLFTDDSISSAQTNLLGIPVCSRVLEAAKCGTSYPKGCVITLEELANVQAAAVASSTKRNNVLSLFDDAKKQRKRLKAGALAALGEESSFDALTPFPRPGEESQSSNVPSLPLASSLSQDFSARPLSRSCAPSLQPDEASGVSESISDQNKSTLSKIVMAGMRLHGLSSRKSANEEISRSAEPSVISNTNTEDEYKAIYHQTVKTVVFALRRHWLQKVLGQEIIRDLVDRSLELFCQDPLSIA